MGIIQASIPLFFILIAAELLFTRLGRRSFYRLNDSVSDLSAGTLSQIAGIFTKLLLIGILRGSSNTRVFSVGSRSLRGPMAQCCRRTPPGRRSTGRPWPVG
jgi:hypothetical protein